MCYLYLILGGIFLYCGMEIPPTKQISIAQAVLVLGGIILITASAVIAEIRSMLQELKKDK